MDKFITLSNGMLTEELPLVASAGAADAGRVLAVDANGKLHESVLPTGAGRDVKNYITSEALIQGDYVNIYFDTTANAIRVRKADASSPLKHVHGFIRDSVGASASVAVYFEGGNDKLTGLSPGKEYFLSTAGTVSLTAPVVSGYIWQKVGVSSSDTELQFDKSLPVIIA